MHAVICRAGKHRVRGSSAVTLSPVRAVRVVPQSLIEFEAGAAVRGLPHRDRFAAGPDDSRPVGRVRLQLPDASQRLSGFSRERDGSCLRLRPALTEVIGDHDRGSPVRGKQAGKDTRRGMPGIQGHAGYLIHKEERSVQFPVCTVGAASQPQPFARADGNKGVPGLRHGRYWTTRRLAGQGSSEAGRYTGNRPDGNCAPRGLRMEE